MCKDNDSNHFAKDCLKRTVYDQGYRKAKNKNHIVDRYNFMSTPKMSKNTFIHNERRNTPVKNYRR